MFIKYCVFFLKFCDFSQLCQLWGSAGVLPAWCVCTHTDWHQGKTEKGKTPENLKIFEKKQYLMNTLYIVGNRDKPASEYSWTRKRTWGSGCGRSLSQPPSSLEGSRLIKICICCVASPQQLYALTHYGPSHLQSHYLIIDLDYNLFVVIFSAFFVLKMIMYIFSELFFFLSVMNNVESKVLLINNAVRYVRIDIFSNAFRESLYYFHFRLHTLIKKEKKPV